MQKSESFFIAAKFGAAQGVKGAVRVISLMENPVDLFSAGPWFVLSQPLERAIPSAKDYQKCTGLDGDAKLSARPSAPAKMSDSKDLNLSQLSPLQWQRNPKGFTVTLSGLTDRDQAQLLTHQLIYLPLEYLESKPFDGYYWRQIIGLNVFDITGQPRGIVVDMLETGANDVLVVSQNNEDSRHLVPYIPDQVIRLIDLDTNKIILDWPFDDDQDEEIDNEPVDTPIITGP